MWQLQFLQANAFISTCLGNTPWQAEALFGKQSSSESQGRWWSQTQAESKWKLIWSQGQMPLGNQLSWNSWSFLKCVSNVCRFDFRLILAWLQVPPICSPQQSDHALAASAALTGSAHACIHVFVGRVSAFFLWALSVWATLRCVFLLTSSALLAGTIEITI